MSTITNEVVESMLRLEEMNLRLVAVHLNKREFDSIIDEVYPMESKLRGMLDVLPGLLPAVLDEEQQYRTDRANAIASWGKEGTHLWGLPVVCDETIPMYWVEVTAA